MIFGQFDGGSNAMFFLKFGATKAKDEPRIEEEDAAQAPTPTGAGRSMVAVAIDTNRKECASRFGALPRHRAGDRPIFVSSTGIIVAIFSLNEDQVDSRDSSNAMLMEKMSAKRESAAYLKTRRNF